MFDLNTQIPDPQINRPYKTSGHAGNRFIPGSCLTAVILLGLLIFSPGPGADSVLALSEADLPLVVIDPGHGGNDSGSQGPDGTQEKTVTLNLAHSISDRMENRCRVVLTRSDDYRLDISERTAVANRSGAEIFISLHTGASFSRSIRGSSVYYHRRFIESALAAEPSAPKSLIDSSRPLSWNQIQVKYRTTSERLANLIQNQLNDVRQTPEAKVQGAPLLVLEGADMPAVVIEIGNLSNPNEEKKLSDPEFLDRIAQAIARGLDTFFTEKPQ